MHPSVKRLLTDGERAARSAPEFHPSDDSAPDLAAAIRAASLRARKSVTEGYLTSPPSSHLKQAPLSLTGAVDYPLSARESNRQLFSSTSGTYSPLPSPSKRKRLQSDPDDDDDDNNNQSIAPPAFPDRALLLPEFTGDAMDVDRPMKPLRRSGRIREVTPTRSLFPSETEMNSHQCERDSTNMRPTQLLPPQSASDNEQH